MKLSRFVSGMAIVTLVLIFSISCRGSSPTPAATEKNTPVAAVTVSPSVAPFPPETPLPADTPTGFGPPCTKIGQIWTSPVDGITLVCVPAGEFLMGAADTDPQARDDEKPQHRVYLDAFWIDRTEVTNVNFAKCLTGDVCHPQVYEVTALTYTPYAVHPAYRDYPALLYEADAAADYCRWADRRLPTEAEWEKAARSPDGRLYPWGNELDCSRAIYFDCDPGATQTNHNPSDPGCGYSSRCRTTRVDDYPAGASLYGALNMAGNVWEWVADWYSPDYYADSPANNPTGPDMGEFKVRRGGGCTSLPQDLRVTARVSGEPHHHFDGQMGFRCAISAAKP